MKIRFLFLASLILIYYFLSNCCIQTAAQSSGKTHGVGRIMCRSCSFMALEDFHGVGRLPGVHDHYAPRLVLHDRESKDFVSAAFTDVIIAPQKPSHAIVVTESGIRAKVPVVPFSAINLFIARDQMPYFLEMAKNEITSIILAYGSEQDILIYQEINFGSRTLPYLTDELEKGNIGDQYKSSISSLARYSELLDELQKLSMMQTRVFIVHMSAHLGSLLFFKAKDIGIMSDSKGNACIITEEMTSYLGSKLNGLSGKISHLSVLWKMIRVIYTEKEIVFSIPANGLSRQVNGTSQYTLGPTIWPVKTVTVPKGWMIPLNSTKLKIRYPKQFQFSSNCTFVTDFSINVVNAVMEALPYDVPYELVPFEGSYGERGGSYDNLVQQVFLKKFDAAVGDTIVTANRSGGVVHYRGKILNGLNCTTHHRAFITIISTVSILSFVLHLLLYIFRNAIHSFWERLKGNFHIEHGERSKAHVLDGSNVMVSIDPNVFVKDSKQ